MYFYLNPECFLIPGRKNGVIYDLISGGMYTIPDEYVKCLAMAETGTSQKEIYAQVEISADKVEKLFSELAENGIGRYYSTQKYIQKLRFGQVLSENEYLPPNVNGFSLEIVPNCMEECWFCDDSLYQSMGCSTCHRWSVDEGEVLSKHEWFKVIDQLVLIGYRHGIIGAGNVKENWAQIKPILDYALECFDTVTIKIPPVAYDLTLINEIIELGGTPDIILDLEDDDKKLKKYTGELKSLTKPFKISLISKTEENPMIQLFKDLAKEVSPHVVIHQNFIATSLEDYKNNSMIAGSKKLQKVNPELFKKFTTQNPCLGGSLAISPTGQVLPCVMMSNRVMGNVRRDELRNLLITNARDITDRGEFKYLCEFWELTKDQVNGCKDCGYRYGCFDCRAMYNEIVEYPVCNYDPYEGQWKG